VEDRVCIGVSTISRLMVLSEVVRLTSIPLQAKQIKGFSEPLQKRPKNHSSGQAGMNTKGLRRSQTDGHPNRVTPGCNFCTTPFH